MAEEQMTLQAVQEKERPPSVKAGFSTNKTQSPSEIRDRIFELKKQLNILHAEKEQWYAKRELLSKEIKKEIAKIKESTKDRDNITASVKEQKTFRRALNKEIFEKIKEVKKLREGTKKEERKNNADALKRQMNALEKQIETEALSFEKEKKIMKQINELKKKYGQAKEEQETWNKVNECSKEITDLKKQADAAHKNVQEKASTSQEKHDSVVITSKHIDALKKQEREAHNTFLGLKQKFNDVNNTLKALLPEMKKINNERDAVLKKKYDYKESIKKKTLHQKMQKVEEKLKKGKATLTLEDLIVFQAKNN